MTRKVFAHYTVERERDPRTYNTKKEQFVCVDVCVSPPLYHSCQHRIFQETYHTSGKWD